MDKNCALALWLLVPCAALPLLLPAGSAEGSGNNLLPDPSVASVRVLLTSVVQVQDPVIDIAHAGDGSGRLFLVSPNGMVRILDRGTLLPAPFLDAPASPPDRAMSALAFHPDFAANGKLYVITGEATPNPSVPHYTAPQSDTSSAFDNVLFEYRVSATDPNAVDPGSRRELLRVHQAHRLHNMNDLAFGGDGYLYVSMGDGGTTRAGTPTRYETNAQDTSNPFGAILRVDVDSVGSNGRYSIPPGNPFSAGPVPEIYSLGVRNPWRLCTDRLSGAVYTASNGDFTIESVLLLTAGANFGWAVKEGSFLWDPLTGNATVDDDPDPSITPPVGEYDHSGIQAFGSVIGGAVYRGGLLPELYGRLVTFDWLAAELMALDLSTGTWELVPVASAGVQLATAVDITLCEGEQGELFIGRKNGEVLRIERAQPRRLPARRKPRR